MLNSYVIYSIARKRMCGIRDHDENEMSEGNMRDNIFVGIPK